MSRHHLFEFSFDNMPFSWPKDIRYEVYRRLYEHRQLGLLPTEFKCVIERSHEYVLKYLEQSQSS